MNAHNPHNRGVYVEDHGVVQPGENVDGKKDQLASYVEGGALAEGKAPEQAQEPEQATPETAGATAEATDEGGGA